MQQNLPGGIMRVVSEENLRESNLLSIYPRYRFESDLFGSEGIPSPSEPGRPIQRYLDMEECPPLELEALDEDKMLRHSLIPSPNYSYYFHHPGQEKVYSKKQSSYCVDDSFSNCSTKFTQTHRFIQGEDDSDSEEGHFSPFSNPNLKVYSSESRVQALETKGTLGQRAVVQGGQILAALRRSKQKRSTEAQEAGVHR